MVYKYCILTLLFIGNTNLSYVWSSEVVWGILESDWKIIKITLYTDSASPLFMLFWTDWIPNTVGRSRLVFIAYLYHYVIYKIHISFHLQILHVCLIDQLKY